MRKYLYIIVLLAVSGLAFTNYCKSNLSINSAKNTLKPYYYDVSEVSKITYKSEAYSKDIEIPVFPGEQYRLVVNTDGVPKKLNIEVYDNKFDAGNKKLLFSNKDISDNQKEFIFEPDYVKRMYVHIEVPAESGESIGNEACVVMVLGFKIVN